MEKLSGIISIELNESLTELSKCLGIDIQKYKPVRFENYPFFSIYCIDLDKSTPEKDFVTKFEIIILDVDRIDELFSKFNLNISVDEKYLTVEMDKGEIIYFPDGD
jgi:hypothetical protein